MLTSEFLDAINEIEETFPVGEWTIGGIRVWPIVRTYLAMQFFEETHAAAPPTASSSRARGVLESWVGFALAATVDRANNSRLDRRVTAVFLSDGVSYTRVAGKAYEKFCDPMMDRLENEGLACLLLSPLGKYYKARHRPSRFIEPRLNMLRAWTFARFKLGFLKPRAHLPDFEAIMGLITRKVPARGLSRKDLELRTCFVEEVSRFFGGIFRRVQPAIGFVVQYYGLVGSAFVLACRRAGIDSVELPHGTPGSLHPAYCRWRGVPRGGFEILPTRFWCWSEPEAAVIAESGAAFTDVHRPVVGANLMQEMWLSGDGSLGAESQERLRKIKEASPARKNVLVALQPGLLKDDLVNLLTQVIARMGGETLFWVRLHPSMLHQREEVKRRFQGDAVIIDLPTDLPLFALLPNMDAHVTYSSSTVVDAEAFGVGSVVLSRYGEEMFRKQQRNGSMVFADTVDGVAAALRGQLSRRVDAIRLRSEAAGRLDRGYESLLSIVQQAITRLRG